MVVDCVGIEGSGLVVALRVVTVVFEIVDVTVLLATVEGAVVVMVVVGVVELFVLFSPFLL